MKKGSVLFAGCLVAFALSVSAHAKPDFAVKEKAACTSCHEPAPPKLNKTGECYKKQKDKDFAFCAKNAPK